MELVRVGGSSGGRRAESAGGQEQGPDGVGGVSRVGRCVLVQVTRRSENVVTFLVRGGESLLSLEHTDVDRLDRWVVLAGVFDLL